MEQEAGEEAVADVGLREAVGTGEPRSDEARAHGRLGRKTEAEVDRNRETGEQIGKPHARRHGCILQCFGRQVAL